MVMIDNDCENCVGHLKATSVVGFLIVDSRLFSGQKHPCS